MGRAVSQVLFAAVLMPAACSKDKAPLRPPADASLIMNLIVSSSAFPEGGTIPPQFTCDGASISPPLTWSAPPGGTQSQVLMCDDPDAPRGPWVHWVVFDLPADATGLAENMPEGDTLPNGAKQGKGDAGQTGYQGPCPPSGTHRYLFTVYALDTVLNLPPGVGADEVNEAISEHILDSGRLIGTYARQ